MINNLRGSTLWSSIPWWSKSYCHHHEGQQLYRIVANGLKRQEKEDYHSDGHSSSYCIHNMQDQNEDSIHRVMWRVLTPYSQLWISLGEGNFN